MSREANEVNTPDAHELHEIDRLLRSMPRVEPSAATLARTRKAVATRGARPRFFASVALVTAGAAALVTVTMSGPRLPDEPAPPDVTGKPGPTAVYWNDPSGAVGKAEPAARGGEFSLFGGLDERAPSRLEARVDALLADGSMPLELRSVRPAPTSEVVRPASSAAQVLRDAARDPASARGKLLTSLAHDDWGEGDRALLEGFAEALRDPSKAADVVWSMQLTAALRAVR